MDKTEYIPSHALCALKAEMAKDVNDKGFFACDRKRMERLVDAIEFSERIRWEAHEQTRREYLDALDEARDANDLIAALKEANAELAGEGEKGVGGDSRFDPAAWMDAAEDSGEPQRYLGDGQVSCSRALRSMFCGWDIGCGCGDTESFFWAGQAFKYIWRFPLKGHPASDLKKAADCLRRAVDAWDAAGGDE